MKFTPRDHTPHHRPPLPKAVEVLGTPEPPTEDFFDIREFLQGEGVQYLRMAVNMANPDEDDFRGLMYTCWIGGFDHELGERLREMPGLKEYMLKEFQDEYKIVVKDIDFEKQNPAFFKQLFNCYGTLIQIIQAFPELKDLPEIQQNLHRDYPYCLKILENPEVDLIDKITDSSGFFVLLPERRSELLTALLKPFEGQPERLIANLQTHDFIGGEVLCLFLFPEQHEQIMQLFHSKKAEFKSAWRTISKKKNRTTREMIDYFGQALMLTMLTAAKVTVSAEGKFHFELKPLPTAKPTPLPERPHN